MIRPENIFWDGEEQNFVMLGDCVIGLPSVYHSMIIETIESAMTPSYARGPGETGKIDNAVKADENAGVVPDAHALNGYLAVWVGTLFEGETILVRQRVRHATLFDDHNSNCRDQISMENLILMIN